MKIRSDPFKPMPDPQASRLIQTFRMVSVVIMCCHHAECQLSHVVSTLRKVQLGCCRRSSLKKAGQPDKLESRQHQSEFPCQLLHETGKQLGRVANARFQTSWLSSLARTLFCVLWRVWHTQCFPHRSIFRCDTVSYCYSPFFDLCTARTTMRAGTVVRTSFEEFFRQRESYHLGFTSTPQSAWPHRCHAPVD